MANLLFDALNAVTLDNQTVQSILDGQLTSDVSSGSNLSTEGPTTITLDEEDLFQCGKCKKQFTSFSLFMCHKKDHSSASPPKLPSLTLPLDGDLHSIDTSQEPGPADSTSYQQLEVQPLDSCMSAAELCQPIILNEADFLSFSLDQNALNINPSSQTSLPLSSVIQPNVPYMANTAESTINRKPLENASATPDTDSFNVALSGQPIILASQLPEGPYMSSTLPSIQSINPQSNTDTSQVVTSSKKDTSQNINILATYPERPAKDCKLLLPNVDYLERLIESGTLLVECDKDKSHEKVIQYRNGAVDNNGTVLLDYPEDPGKSCKVLLANGEYADTSIEYIDSANNPDICEDFDLSDVEGHGRTVVSESVTVSLLDVVQSDSVTMDLSKAVNEPGNGQAIGMARSNLSIPSIPDSSTSTIANMLPLPVSNNALSSDCNSSSNLPIDIKDAGRLSVAKNLKLLKCEFCHKVFTKNFDLQQHMRSHTGEKPFQCVVCGRAFSQKSNVKKHMATHKVWPNGLSRTLPKEPLQLVNNTAPSESQKLVESAEEDSNCTVVIDRSYVCQYCNTSFTSYFELKTHMKKHSHQKVYKCVQAKCQKTFEDLDSFLEHTSMHTDEAQYNCHVCSKNFTTLVELGVHQYSHNPRSKPGKNPRYFLCIKCKSKFTSSKALEQHLSTTNHNFPCTHCGKVFTCERYLRRHLPTHGAPESYICSTCGKGFRTEQYLNTHRLIHSGEKPYACMHCSAAFNRKDKLVRHSLIHQAVKKFKCPFHNYLGCPKEFNRQDKLKVHILTHSAFKPIYCRKCNKIFHKQSSLRDHERNHHSSDALFACARCSMKFRKKTHLVTHVCNEHSTEFNKNTTPPPVPLPGNVNSPPTPVKQPRSRRLKKVRNSKRTTTTTTSKNADSTAEHHMEDAAVESLGGDNVPTIEIIVMPMSLNERKNRSPEDKNVYRVMFPASCDNGEMQTKLIQGGVTEVVKFSTNPRDSEANGDQTVINVSM